MASKSNDSSFAANLERISTKYRDASLVDEDVVLKPYSKSKQTKASVIASTPIEEISRLKATNPADMKKMSQILSTLQQSFIRRANQFIDKRIYSYSLMQVLMHEPSRLTPAEIIKKSTAGAKTEKEMNKALTSARNKMLREIVLYQKFFSDKTSTIRGVYDVHAAHARRIFGETPSGKPVYMPTQNEWSLFWAIYNEYNNVFKTDNSNLYSGLVQQSLAAVMQRRGSYAGNYENLIDTLNSVREEVHNRLDQENAEEYRSDWSDFEDADELPY